MLVVKSGRNDQVSVIYRWLLAQVGLYEIFQRHAADALEKIVWYILTIIIALSMTQGWDVP